ncbi:hypothetical protein HDV57DRAFT_448572 [Trichoderma longibrachiatum]
MQRQDQRGHLLSHGSSSFRGPVFRPKFTSSSSSSSLLHCFVPSDIIIPRPLNINPQNLSRRSWRLHPRNCKMSSIATSVKARKTLFPGTENQFASPAPPVQLSLTRRAGAANHSSSCLLQPISFFMPFYPRRNLRPIWILPQPPPNDPRQHRQRGSNRDNPELAGLHRFLDQLAWFLINDFGSCCSHVACINTARALGH